MIPLREALPYLLDGVSVLVLAFKCRIDYIKGKPTRESDTLFFGPALRGAFGYSFKDVCCSSKDRNLRLSDKYCPDDCECFYKSFFISPAPPDLPHPYRGRTYMTHPFSIRAPWIAFTDSRTEREFDFEVTLVGEAAKATSEVVEAFRLVGEKGLGTPGWSTRFSIETVRQILPGGSQVIWKGDVGTVVPICMASTVGSYLLAESGQDEGHLSISLTSPLDLQYKRQTIQSLESLTEEIFTISAARALEEMGVFWCGLYPIGEKPVFENNDRLIHRVFRQKKYSCYRYSHQEKNNHSINGVFGRLSYPEAADATHLALRAAYYIGVGQNRGYGFGRYRLSWPDEC